jgi:hypothetical protein
MKSIKQILVFILLFVAGCAGMQDKRFAEVNRAVVTTADSIRFIPSEKENVWKEYKRSSGIDHRDTLPLENRFIKIDGNKFSYYFKDSLLYTDYLIRDTLYKFPVYSFRNSRHDKLHFLKSDSTEIVLKHFPDEGDYEYFRKISP